MLDHAAGPDPRCLPDLVHLDGERDPLVAAHGEEVDVDESPVDVVALDLAWDREVRLAVHLQVDERRSAAGRVEQVQQILARDAQLHRVHAVAVQDAGDEAGRPEAPRGTLAGVVAELGGEGGFHGGQDLKTSSGTATMVADGGPGRLGTD